MIPSVRRVVVLGGGSAGFLAALAVKTACPDIDVELVRSREIGIIGVGEATTPFIPTVLHSLLQLDLAEFYREANPSWKLGIQFLWGPRKSFNYSFQYQCSTRYTRLQYPTGFYCRDNFEDATLLSSMMDSNRCFERGPNGLPVIGRDAAYHLENKTFVGFLENTARRRGIAICDDTVAAVEQDDAGVACLKMASGRELRADLFVDCSGFRSLLLGQALHEPFKSYASSLYCDRAIIGGWDRDGEPVLPFTVAETMNAGWCWRIDHERSINRGYVHSSAFLNEEEATREFLAKNPKVKKTAVVKFKSGRYERLWVKNVVAIGNSSGFVEPLESTGLSGIGTSCQTLVNMLRDTPTHGITSSMVRHFNDSGGRYWDAIRNFLAVHYRFNRRLDTPFWRACLADADLAGAEPIVEFYRENGPSMVFLGSLCDRYDQFKLEGYWTLLVGQQVEYKTPIVIPDEQMQIWRQIRESNRRAARNSLTAEEAFAAIRRPDWRWDNRFYDGGADVCGMPF